ncbi:MAG TPA: thiolase family protein [Syntrophorhabdaceae bacterium]|nr:thiolase family protein [Syntrophorhabdaceae bacterium]HPA07251.1 thiolase family protein [Methanoregulaceae archaeon]
MRNTYIVGVHTLKFGKYLDRSIKDLTRETVTGALKDAGLDQSAIQSVWFSNSGWGMVGQTCIRGEVALRPMGIDCIPMTNVENACAGGSTALHGAWLDVASGLFDISLAVGAEKLYHPNRMATFAGFLGGIDIEECVPFIEQLTSLGLSNAERAQMQAVRTAYHLPDKPPRSAKPLKRQYEDLRDSIKVGLYLGELLGYGTVRKLSKVIGGDHSTFMDIYGYIARAHMRRYGSTIEQLAAIASKNHFNSTLNPNAQYRFEVSVEQAIADRTVSWPLTRSMCAPIGDGAAAAVVCSEDFVQRNALGSQAVRIRASILGTGRARPMDIEEMEIGQRLARQAYDQAGVGPQDINVAEVHDATAFGELRQAENLGFCAMGEGGLLAASGATRIDGRIPINPSGGLISRGHPIGASGLAQIHEIVTQLRGRADKRQVRAPRLALAENGGGALGTEEAAMCIHILEAPGIAH